MKTSSMLRSFPAVLAITLCAYGLSAHAQAPADPAARPASAAKADEGVVDKTKRVTKNAAAGTKRVANKATDATKRGANRAAGAVRNTGEKIGEKVPPGPNDGKIDSTGQPKTTP
ncbi:MAG TPA: hypothetical protein VLJ57_25070 [Burkholderiaceae bacterium]|nr:hypothetical protein [Burkholderiaceae bacterium]